MRPPPASGSTWWPVREEAAPAHLAGLLERARAGELGADPSSLAVATAFLTLQRSRHPGRDTIYTNHLVSVRVGRAVGSCYVEAGEVGVDEVDALPGQSVGALLEHPRAPVRVAALDAYLAELCPHDRHPAAHPVTVPGGTSLDKSLFRARSVVDLLGPRSGDRVALIGVVNSLVRELEERGARALPCDFNVRETEWGRPVAQDMREVLRAPDAILATGMTLGNGTFDALLARAGSLGVPLVLFAQTGSAIARAFV
jgi:hypothetical protein